MPAITAEYGRALLARLLERALHALERRAVDERTDQRAFLERIADRQAAIGGLEPLHQGLMHRFMDDEAPQRRASLARGADGGECDRPQHEVEVRARRDDRRIVAAQL